MKRELFERWRDALRSGKYKQCRLKMYEPATNCYCALGVLVAIHPELTKEKRASMLRACVLQEHGLVDLTYEEKNRFMVLNDSYNLDFNQIALGIHSMVSVIEE